MELEFKPQESASMVFPGGSVVKNPHANARDTDSIPGSEDSLEGMEPTPVSWRIPWTEGPGVLQSIGLQKTTP